MKGTIILVLFGALVLFSIYRRFRRSFGEQPVRERSMLARMALLFVVGILLLLPPFFSLGAVAAAVLGAAIGVGVGLYAVIHTRVEVRPEGAFYTPHPYIGLGITTLFIGRLAYRLFVTWPAMQAAMHGQGAHYQGAQTLASYQHSPLSVASYFLFAGYYVYYYASVVMRSRALAPARA